MTSPFLYLFTASVLVVLTTVFMLHRKQDQNGQKQATKPLPLASVPPDQLPEHIQNLITELPGQVLLQSDAAFQQAVDASWAQPVRETIPTCIVRPTNTEQLSKVVKILKREHDIRKQAGGPITGFFTVRSGGANTGLGTATSVLIDLSKFCEVTPGTDGTVVIGTGAKWIDVYKALDEKGLIAIGARSSPVGVGGLALQGGISFYSPRFGFVCSNVSSYEVVLADGSIVTASSSMNPELWRVLKGGSNNFGIVTRFTLRTIPSAPVWTAQIFGPMAFQHEKALKAYHEYLNHASTPEGFDENAAGPIMTFAYVQSIGLKLIVLTLQYTKAPEDKKWPMTWQKTGFPSIWGYRKSGVETHTAAVERFGAAQPPGTRHLMATTTIRNDIDTMKAAYTLFLSTTSSLRHVSGLLFPFVFQAILPGWMNKGYSNVLGLENCTEPLIILNWAITWDYAKDDEVVRSSVRRMTEQIEAAAIAKKTSHPYRFMNYCAEWQKPYAGCGEANKKLMKEASQKYDPDGLFQAGCSGGFKLDFLEK